MVRADTIDAIDRILRVYSHNLREPFGGKQILLVGDVFQLEPVVKNDEREIINRFYPHSISSRHAYLGDDSVSIELKKVYRQTDKVFVVLGSHRTSIPQEQRPPTTQHALRHQPQAIRRRHASHWPPVDSVDFINDKN